jgi:hypothetical protein
MSCRLFKTLSDDVPLGTIFLDLSNRLVNLLRGRKLDFSPDKLGQRGNILFKFLTPTTLHTVQYKYKYCTLSTSTICCSLFEPKFVLLALTRKVTK